jgi:ATP-dependent DNA ligase
VPNPDDGGPLRPTYSRVMTTVRAGGSGTGISWRLTTPKTIAPASRSTRFRNGQRLYSRRYAILRFIEPCLPSPADRPLSGANWIHEIKHDGYRLMARRDPIGIRLITRPGKDWADRFLLIVEAVRCGPA